MAPAARRILHRHLLLYSAISIFLYLGSGVIGTFHHLYWSGSPTPIHSHTALLGVYGLLAIQFMPFSMRHTVSRAAWSDGLLKWGFRGLNGGLALMTFVSLVPSGCYRFNFAVRDGL